MIDGLDEMDKAEIKEIGIFKVHSEYVSKLPENTELLGSSTRTRSEIWSIGDQILCMQASPEVNRTYIKNLIIEKLYDEGKLDDLQKNKSLDELDEEFIPISRHFMLKCLHEFLKTPNTELLRIYKEYEREERKKEE